MKYRVIVMPVAEAALSARNRGDGAEWKPGTVHYILKRQDSDAAA